MGTKKLHDVTFSAGRSTVASYRAAALRRERDAALARIKKWLDSYDPDELISRPIDDQGWKRIVERGIMLDRFAVGGSDDLKPGKPRLRTRSLETRGARSIAFIERFCRVPEGPNVGKPIILEDFERQFITDVLDNPHGTKEAILSIAKKNGKALALDTPIPTPSGWRPMRDVHAGDLVFGSNGKPTTVLAESPVYINKKCYRVRFADGSEIVAAADHLWTTHHRWRPWTDAPYDRRKADEHQFHVGTLTTEQIASSLNIPTPSGSNNRNHKVLVAPQLETNDVALPIDPYTFGVWLGDGCSKSADVTSGALDLEHFVTQLEATSGYPVRVFAYRNATANTNTGYNNRGEQGFVSKLRVLGVFDNKHIPESYLESGTAQRWALLQGLMDTDGTIHKPSQRCSYSSISEQLARGVWRLARSLGIKATLISRPAKLYGRVICTQYLVSFAATKAMPVFRLGRKQRLITKDDLGCRSKTNAIIACEEVKSVPVKCIQVAAVDSLYLAGHGCIPTHNSGLIAALLLVFLLGPEARYANAQIVSGAMEREQAAIVFKYASKMVALNPILNRLVNTVSKKLYGLPRNIEFRALAAVAKSTQGISPFLAILDEIGQVRGPQSEFVDAIETSQGAYKDALRLIISTQAAEDGDLLSIKIDRALEGKNPHIICHLYTADANCDVLDETQWAKANPGLGTIRSVEDLRELAMSASEMPSFAATFRNFNLNQRIATHAYFVPPDVWEANGQFPDNMQGAAVWGGLDLASVNDLCSLVLEDQKGNVWPFFWLPAQGLREKSKQDKAPYEQWHKEGLLFTTPGATVEYEHVAEFLRGVFDTCNVQAIGFDRHFMRFLTPWLDKAGFSKKEMEKFVEFGQGFVSMAPAIRSLESKLLNKKLRHGGNPILRMCASNVVVERDAAGNRKFNKARSTGRIDGMVALTIADGVMPSLEEPPKRAFRMVVL